MRIESDFEFRGQRRRVESLTAQEVEGWFAGLRAESVAASDSGDLAIRFADATELLVPADRDYEAWTLTAESGFRIVSLPGGGLAVWRPEGA